MPNSAYEEWLAGFKRHYHAVAQELKIDAIAAKDTMVQLSTHPIDSVREATNFWTAEFAAAGQEALQIKNHVLSVYHAGQDWYHNSRTGKFIDQLVDGKQTYDSVKDTTNDFKNFETVSAEMTPLVETLALTGPAVDCAIALLAISGVTILCLEMLNAITMIIAFTEHVIGANDAVMKQLAKHTGTAKDVGKALDPLKDAKAEAEKLRKAEEELAAAEKREKQWQAYAKKFREFEASLGPYQERVKKLAAVGAKLEAMLHQHKH